MLIPLLQNVSMLLAIVVIYALVGGRHGVYLLHAKSQDLVMQLQTGVMIGLIAVAMILTPVRYAGLLLDARSILLSLTALFLGIVPSLVALTIATLYRIYTGGPGIAPAMIVMATSILAGLLWRRFRTPKVAEISLIELYLFGLSVHIAIVLLAYVTPPALLLVGLKGVAEPLLLIFPLAEVVIGGLLVRFAREEVTAQHIALSEERYRLLADNVTDIILQHDLEGRIDYVSPSVSQLGYEPEMLIGLVRFDFIHPDDVDALRQRMREVGEGGPGGRIDARVHKSDGRWMWIESMPSAVRNDEGKIVGVLSVCRDVSARMEAETTLREVRAEMARAARISALGAFSASLAHEINQPLGALVINSDVARRLLETDQPDLAKVSRAIERSARDARRASDIVARMRSLTTRRPAEAADFNLNEAISEILALSRGELQRWNVSVETALSPDTVVVHGDRVQIQQVMLNLVQNAIEAMHDTPEAERRLRVRSTLADNGEALVEVEDRGPGLDPQTSEAIFGHLYTTKEGGTGLGLAISKSIIESHGGRIWAEAAPPYGALFKFCLPLQPDDA
ncbi:MAG TPA: ATP-binding protein [Caulobacteraceae bacterium]|jgi:PAS domain S-box-containing protein